MNAPLSPFSRTGSRLVSVRERTKLLVLKSRGRSHEATVGVSPKVVTKIRSRSTPAGTPRKNLRSAYANLPSGLESG